MNPKFITEQLINDIYNIVVNSKQESIQIDEETGKYNINDDIGTWGNFRVEYIREHELNDKEQIKTLIKDTLMEWTSIE